MLSNYWKIAVRNLFKNRLFSLINIFGMAISMASVLCIGLFVYDELKFDDHIEDADQKFRVFTEYTYADGGKSNYAMIPPMVAPQLKEDFAEVAYFTRMMHINSPALMEYGELKFTERDGAYADTTVFDMFTLSLVEGDAKDALAKPRNVAINKTLKQKYFGDSKALGQTIEIYNEPFIIGAVFEDFPTHAHLQLKFFMSMEYLNQEIPERMKAWQWSQFHTYVKLNNAGSATTLTPKLKPFAERYAWPETKPNYYVPHLLNIKDVHLHAADHTYDIAVKGNIQTVNILAGTAIFILLVAILNFVNLSTARALNRVKEVGVRKVVGAVRTQLIFQFITESIVISVVALLIGGLMTELAIPSLNVFTEKQIPQNIFLTPSYIIVLFLFAILTGILAGAYPALYISQYKPADILSNKSSGPTGRMLLRKGLVVLQFMLSFLLIIASFVVSEQHAYMRNKDMGFQKDNVIAFQIRGNMSANPDATKNSFKNHENIIEASFCYGLPGEAYAGDGITDMKTNQKWAVSMLLVDHDYSETLGLKLLAGRDFSTDFPSDEKKAFIVTKSAIALFGYQQPEEAIGHPLSWGRWDTANSLKQGTIVGVIDDLHLSSLKEDIRPVVLHVYPYAYTTLTLRVKPDHLPVTIKHLEETWKAFNTEWPFEYRFLDENIDKLYKAEEKLATLFTVLTAITIFVACMGLFGLVVYTTTQRYKEISIRKVLGAAEFNIIVQLGKSYVLLLAIAFAIAIPLSIYLASAWLETFPNRIDVTPILFLKAGALILLLSFITIGFQSIRAARTNPVRALKEQ